MSFERCKDTAIVIPARNEADRIGDCLTALAPQCSERVRVVLVVNNTNDDTAEIAQAHAARVSIDLTVLNLILRPGMGVGAARQKGCALALEQMPHLRQILTSDADCRVSPDWVALNIHHLQRSDVVCGKVELHPGEAVCLAGLDPILQDYETAYRQLVLELYARYAPHCADLSGSHGGAPGASLGFTRAAYESVGGFAPIPCGEDRQIVRAMRELGKRVRHADDIWVEASCRLVGRAEGGMADTLRTRLAGPDYLADDCLPDAGTLLDQQRQGKLGCGPPHVPNSKRVPVRELPSHIAQLSAFLHRPESRFANALPRRTPAQLEEFIQPTSYPTAAASPPGQSNRPPATKPSEPAVLRTVGLS
jgi:cellulose synthase/poly-beta-1,6-N-acetylglucosamine synthase-like glycosyltransferase